MVPKCFVVILLLLFSRAEGRGSLSVEHTQKSPSPAKALPEREGFGAGRGRGTKRLTNHVALGYDGQAPQPAGTKGAAYITVSRSVPSSIKEGKDSLLFCPPPEKGVVRMTYTEILMLCMLLVSIIDLVYRIAKKK